MSSKSTTCQVKKKEPETKYEGRVYEQTVWLSNSEGEIRVFDPDMLVDEKHIGESIEAILTFISTENFEISTEEYLKEKAETNPWTYDVSGPIETVEEDKAVIKSKDFKLNFSKEDYDFKNLSKHEREFLKIDQARIDLIDVK